MSETTAHPPSPAAADTHNPYDPAKYATTNAAPAMQVLQEVVDSETSLSVSAAPVKPSLAEPQKKTFSFWMVLLALIITLFLAVLESYAISTTLPVMIADLKATTFVWVAVAYGIASTALLPLSGCLAQIFGRRPVMLGSIAFFAAGSAIGGAAKDMAMLLAGRTLQGAGAGGINALTQIILSDLVTLQERGKYNGLIAFTWALSGGVGPLIGGALAHHTTWRWLFYLNIPLAGICLALILIFLRVPTPPGTFRDKLSKIDWVGNILVIAATTGCAIALAWGGVTYPWKSPRVLAPLCICLVGLIAWLLYETFVARVPAIPLFSNRTTFSGYVQMSLSAFIIASLVYYLPVYYQACKDASPIASGVDLLALSFSTAPIAIPASISVPILKRYRPQIYVGWALTTIGVGLISTLTEDSSKGKSVGFQIIAGLGIGTVWACAYFPVLAPLPVTMSAYALSAFMFLRNLFQVWGVTVGGAILQNELQHHLPDSIFSSGLVAPGEAFTYAVIPLIPSLPQPEKDAVRHAFATSLTTIWRVLIVIGGVGFLVSLLMKDVPLHGYKDENWALEEKKAKGKSEGVTETVA